MHKCYRYNNLKEGYEGEAISLCYETKNGDLWVTNDEYGNRVNYCPFCGYKAKNQVEKE